MKHRLYTVPDFFEGEADLINQLFEEGLPCLHFRKTQRSIHPFIDLLLFEVVLSQAYHLAINFLDHTDRVGITRLDKERKIRNPFDVLVEKSFEALEETTSSVTRIRVEQLV